MAGSDEASPPASAAAPYYSLTPDRVLDAVESTGLQVDGRQLALNSYENRVYQVGLDGAAPVVAKFYRPNRWSDAQILEEHAFTRELADREVPVVAPLAFAGKTLLFFEGFRFALYPRCGGRAPELESRETLEWMGRFIGRIHAVGRLAPFRERPAIEPERFGYEPAEWLLDHGFVPEDLSDAWEAAMEQALEGIERCYDKAGSVATLRLHGDCHAGNVLWQDEGESRGPHFVDFDDSLSGPAIQDLWMLLPQIGRAHV